ncbi:hypothetical protein [Haemophilus haemolyticus]|uniref:hypothetical protein n=1 Tax=Haemophilus haemolyticus TaxID=726 RepID=UPI00112B4B78|nr:hypothetical protein [Haemophilus haemolyticus]TPH27812.1 hypothetical protein EUX56_00785 [Haemophilus haemolyticus]
MELKHKTFFYNSLSILRDKTFYTEASLRGGNDEKICSNYYDSGINFLPNKGEVNNHEIGNRDSYLIFNYSGKISNILPPEAGVYEKEANILYDYNGSQDFFENNDPRYLLRFGSKDLQLIRIEKANNLNDGSFVECLSTYLGGKWKFYAFLYKKCSFVKNYYLNKFNQKFIEINEELGKNPVSIEISMYCNPIR